MNRVKTFFLLYKVDVIPKTLGAMIWSCNRLTYRNMTIILYLDKSISIMSYCAKSIVIISCLGDWVGDSHLTGILSYCQYAVVSVQADI